MMMTATAETIQMTLPCRSGYVGVVRLTASGIASRLGFSIEDIEDIKVAVSEACTNAIQYAYRDPADGRIEVDFACYSDRLEISIRDFGQGFDVAATKQTKQAADDWAPDDSEKLGMGLGLTFIEQLMDVSKVDSIPGKGTTVVMVKRLSVD